ncbi:MAG: flagellar protein FlaG [Ectothiorhodospiraceae bacterium]|nr:flagellar protein FlaG [Ectothiorhodospiraceae bacterium]
MDISNLTTTNTVATSVAKPSGGGGANKLAAQGIILPETAAPVAGSETIAKSDNTALQPDTKELRNLVNQANATLQARSSDLKFTVDEASNISVVRIEDSDTGELIRQIPSKAMLAIAQALEEFTQGSVLEEKA